MKAYLIGPPFEMYGVQDERTAASIELITEIVLNSLRSGGDEFHYALVWSNPGEEPDGSGWNSDIAEPHIFPLHDADKLRAWLRRAIDPNAVGAGDVRSIATCRSVTFGYDGQAFLCLRYEDQAPLSSNPELAIVEERSELLIDSDYFDGWVRT